MRVKLSSNPPLALVRAWFALPSAHGQTISAFKSLLCTSLPAFRGVSPSSLHLSVDGFELLDNSELAIVRDGDLICVDSRDVPSDNATRGSTYGPAPSRKRKRHASTPESTTKSTSSSESESESDSSSESESDSTSSSVGNSAEVARVPSKQKPVPSTFVPPGYGKPQTRARNLRRRLKRMHDREGEGETRPLSGANAVVPAPGVASDTPAFMSLSLRNKNKAKNFKSLMGRTLPAKIIFGDEQVVKTPPPRLIPPSSRSLLPPKLFVTSVDVEAEEENGEDEDGDRDGDGDGDEEVVERLESMANQNWATLARPTRDSPILRGAFVSYKALGIDPVTRTPSHVLTVARVESCDSVGMAVRPLRAVASYWSGDADADAEPHTWDEILRGDWRVLA